MNASRTKKRGNTPRRLSLVAFTLVFALALLTSPAGATATTVWAVGDGAAGTPDSALVANTVVAAGPDAFLYLGDVYDSGTNAEFLSNYAPTFGQLKTATHPTPGNHEWGNRATGYDPYWGPALSSPHYYSFDVGSWHFVSLNSEEAHDTGSAQLQWLAADLAAHPGDCTVAYWHRPRFSAGSHGDQVDTDPLWAALRGHAAIVLNGHDHVYERMLPIDGITEFVVGTGGKSIYGINLGDARLAASDGTNYGALRLDLFAGRADYSFVTTTQGTGDSGSVACSSGVTPPTPPAAPLAITGLKLHRSTVRVYHRTVVKLTGSYSSSAAATVTPSLLRRSAGVYKSVGVLRPTATAAALAGANKLSAVFRKKRGHAFRAGHYKLVLVASDAAGSSSAAAYFRVR